VCARHTSFKTVHITEQTYRMQYNDDLQLLLCMYSKNRSLKRYCEFADINYRQLLSHSRTTWLPLFPAVERLLQTFPAVKSFFLSEFNPPVILKKFFENELGQACLCHIPCQCSIQIFKQLKGKEIQYSRFRLYYSQFVDWCNTGWGKGLFS
jgi:hypothetical protein